MRHEKVRPRCPRCKSANIALDGQAEWDRLTQRWVIRQAAHATVGHSEEPRAVPIDAAKNFFCRSCG